MGNCQQVNEQDILLPSNFQGIVINCRTWKKTYSNLYDYTCEPDQYVENNLNVGLVEGDACVLGRTGEVFSIVKEGPGTDGVQDGAAGEGEDNAILKLCNKNGCYYIQPSLNLQKLTSNQIWLAVKSTPTKKYRVREGDILRIGNQKIKVKQIIFEDNSAEANIQVRSQYKVYESLTKQNSKGYDPQQGAEQPTCRVCLEQGQLNNPLIAPCKCSGSAKFIHIKCIQQWFNKLINPRKINAALIISWKPLVCQLCSQSLPFKIYLDQVKHFTVNIPRPEKPYIVLNPVTKQKSNTKLYYLVSFNQKKILTIGRKKEADVVLDQDSTVSRFHSTLQLQLKDPKSGRITISDKDSKFGTLVLLKKPINLSNIDSSLILQFGGHIVTLTSKNKNKKIIGSPQEEINHSEKSTSSQTLNNDHQQESQ